MKQIESAIIQLIEFHESKPVLKALIQAITYKDLPVGAFGDTVLSTYVSNLKTAKLQTFFEQLDNGEMELTEDLITNNDFYMPILRRLIMCSIKDN